MRDATFTNPQSPLNPYKSQLMQPVCQLLNHMNQQLKLLIQLFTTALTARARHTDSIGHRQDIPVPSPYL
jgi:hypothetical protein